MRSLAHQVSFGDLELRRRSELTDSLTQISDVLDAVPELLTMVHGDLVAGLKKPGTGRAGLTPIQVLRAFVLQRMENLDLRSLAVRISDGISCRVFAGFDAQPVPSHHAFNRAFNRLRPETIRRINEAVVRRAVVLGVEDGRMLRVDTTVVETNIRFPTDAGLLWDSNRVITRWVRRLLVEVPRARSSFHDRTRSARRRYQAISRMTRQERQTQQPPKYREMIRITEETVAIARTVSAKARTRAQAIAAMQPERAMRIWTLIDTISRYCNLADRVLAQTRRRVLRGEQVPVAEKVFSVFEPHTDLIVRGKTNKPVEFGHKVFLAESGAGLITEYRVLDGNPTDDNRVAESLDSHRHTFNQAPDLYAADRGFYSAAALAACSDAGVKLECIPYRGGAKSIARATYEKSKPFKRGQRFRAGIEGRISVLVRGRGMRRCLSFGRRRFEVLVGLAVLANNLLVLATLLSTHPRRRKPAA